MISLLLSGLFLIGLALFGGSSPQIRRHKRVYLVLGAALVLAWYVPQMAHTFAESYRIGSEIRERQGR